MGCDCSREAGADLRKIHSDFDSCKLPAFDDFFKSAGELLKKAEEIREPIAEAMIQMEEACDIDGLLHVPESPLFEATKIFLWSVAAANNGKIEALKLNISEKDPWITLDEGVVTPEQRAFLDPLKRWLEALKSGPQ